MSQANKIYQQIQAQTPLYLYRSKPYAEHVPQYTEEDLCLKHSCERDNKEKLFTVDRGQAHRSPVQLLKDYYLYANCCNIHYERYIQGHKEKKTRAHLHSKYSFTLNNWNTNVVSSVDHPACTLNYNVSKFNRWTTPLIYEMANYRDNLYAKRYSVKTIQFNPQRKQIKIDIVNSLLDYKEKEDDYAIPVRLYMVGGELYGDLCNISFKLDQLDEVLDGLFPKVHPQVNSSQDWFKTIFKQMQDSYQKLCLN